ncbi:hypothetical protein C3B61_16440 [Cryobacterium zongtaii]|uniref:non-specific serine/threonine protein kinase n=1 Tax=Cryobacterium zongtaii TaxID=1259217 RepID=A0A2S3ZA81_9MICO|nr:hypothetical protein C3B61_16440 [Cryobacterium zongtaii]
MGCGRQWRRNRRPPTDRRRRAGDRPVPLRHGRPLGRDGLAGGRLLVQPRRELRRFRRRGGERLRSADAVNRLSGPVAGLISERYRLGALLGTGGSASVFAAVDTRSGETIALKILHPVLSSSPRLREAFFREARAAAGVRHPNIVAVLDVGVHDDAAEPLAWIALDLAPGESLAEHVGRTGPLPVPDALTVALAVLQALAAAHAAGLIHRDVSPANIMIAPGGDGRLDIAGVRLLDFGLADAAGRAAVGSDVLGSEPADGHDPDADEDRPVGVLGSVNYLSPEQAAGVPVDERGDLYQLGGVLYFALTGEAPYVRDTVAAVMRAHALAPPPVPSVARAGIPRGVDRIVVRALLKHREDRFTSAAEMRNAILALTPPAPADTGIGDDRTRRFDRLVDGLPHAVTDPGPTTVLPRTAQRPPGGATAGSATGSAAGSPSVPRPGRQRPGGGRAAGWVALVLVAGVIAAGWVAAAGGSARSFVAVSSTPSATAAEVSTDMSTAPPAPVEAPSPSVQVPELTIMPLGEARAALEAAGLRLGSLTPADSVRTGDTVLALEPGPGSWLNAGDTVDLVVASGSNSVPATVGLASAEAVAALQNAGFVAVVETRIDGATVPGTVLASHPDPAAVLRLGTSVTITVAAAAPVHPTATPSSSPGPSTTPTNSAPPAPSP